MPRFSFRSLAAVAAALVLLVGAFTVGAVTSARGQGVAAAPLTTIPAQTPTPSSLHTDRTIAVTGTGIATLAPDIARFSVGVAEQGANLSDVQGKVAAESDAITTALRSGGIDVQKDVKTANYSIQVLYDYPKDKAAVLSGYRVSNTLAVTVRDISGNRVGNLLDATVRAGANNIGSITFGLADPDAANRTARDEAVKNAKAKADALAQASGAAVGPVITISDTTVTPSAPRDVQYAAAPAASSSAAAPSAPIHPARRASPSR